MADKLCQRWDKQKVNADDTNKLINEDSLHNKTCTVTNLNPAAGKIEVLPSTSSTQNKTVSATKLEVLPSTSSAEEKMSNESSYVLMNSEMWRSLLCNIKCDECNSHSLEVVTKGAYGFSTKV